MWFLWKYFLVGVVAFGFLGCGGDDNNNPPNPVGLLQIKGILAVGAAVPDVVVAAKCQNSNWVSSPTKSNGAFEFLVADSAPCVLSAKMGDGAVYNSISVLGGVSNITPITDLIFRLAGGQSSKAAEATNLVINNLPKVGVELFVDPVSTEFVANGAGLDMAIEQYVKKAVATNLSGAGSNQKVVSFSGEWASQCMNSSLCVPIQSMLPAVPQGVSDEDKSWWASTFTWAQARLQSAVEYSKSMGSALAVETQTAYVDGYLTEQSSALNGLCCTTQLAGGRAVR